MARAFNRALQRLPSGTHTIHDAQNHEVSVHMAKPELTTCLLEEDDKGPIHGLWLSTELLRPEGRTSVSTAAAPGWRERASGPTREQLQAVPVLGSWGCLWSELAVRQEDDVSQLGTICSYTHREQSPFPEGHVLSVLRGRQHANSLLYPVSKRLLGVCSAPSALGNENVQGTNMVQDPAPTEVSVW